MCNRKYTSYDNKELGKQIEARRKEVDLRQENLAEMSGLTIRTIHNIEAGKGNPAFNTLNKVFEVLGLAINVDIKIMG